jgi:ABC-type transport system substrate-binding protein
MPRPLLAILGALLLALPAPAAPLKTATIPIRTDGPKSLDPARGSTQYDNLACSQIYDTLLQFKYLARPLALEPLLLAEMPRTTVNPDGTQTWSFTLRDDARFQDDPCFPGGKGRRVVSADVFYSWKRLVDPVHNLKNAWLIEGLIVGFDDFRAAQAAAVDAGKPFDYDAPVAGFRVIDDRRFEVVLLQPVQQFAWKLAQFQLSVVPREAVEKYGLDYGKHPVGSGPFVCREGDWQPGRFLNLTRNPTYRDERYPSDHANSSAADAAHDQTLGLYEPAGQRLPLLDRVECVFYVPDPPMWLDFESGKLGFTQVPAEYFDKAFNRRTLKLRPEYAKRGVTSHATPLLDFIFRGFNMEDPVVGGYDEKKIKLRRALSLAFDLDEMNESFYNGTSIVYDGPIPPGLDGFPEGGNGPVSVRGPNLARAKRLLAEAGYPDGRGLPDIVYYTSRGGNQEEQVQAEVQFARQIGVRLSPRLVDFSELIEAINKKSAPLFGFAWGSDYPDAENNLSLFYSKNKAPGSNSFNYDRPEFDRLYERARTMPPGPDRTALYEQMRDMIVRDCPYIGSTARTRFWVANPWLKNLKPSEEFNNWFKYLDVDDTKRGPQPEPPR